MKEIKDKVGGKFSGKFIIKGEELANATNLYEQLKAYNNILQNFSTISQASGEILERYLKIFARKRVEWEQTIMEDITAKTFSRLTGQDIKSRGGGIINLTQISIQNFDANKTYNLVDHISSNNFIMDVEYNTGAEKQIKMDVELFFSGGNYGQGSDFRISAKNWARIGAYGNLRSAWENLGKIIEQAMVKPLEKTQGLTLHGYFFEPLKQTALTTYKEGLRGIETPGRTNTFLKLYYGYLKNIKVSMSINSNIFNQGTDQI